MPKAKTRLEPKTPAPLTPEEAALICAAVKRFFGVDAVVRNFGPDPRRLELHVETSSDDRLAEHKCLGDLMCRIERDAISMTVSRRNERTYGEAKIAYRQGVIL